MVKSTQSRYQTSKHHAIMGVAALGVIAAAVASAQVVRKPRADLAPDLTKSVGLDCVVYLRAPGAPDQRSVSNFGGFQLELDRPVVVRAVLTAVGDDAITLRTDQDVFWVPRDHIALITFRR